MTSTIPSWFVSSKRFYKKKKLTVEHCNNNDSIVLIQYSFSPRQVHHSARSRLSSLWSRRGPIEISWNLSWNWKSTFQLDAQLVLLQSATSEASFPSGARCWLDSGTMGSVAMLNPTLTLTILLLTMMYILSTLNGSPLPAGKTGPGPSVKTRYGIVQGMILSLPNPLNPVEVFLGIPYATPPLGINRFSPTRNPQSWSGTRMADRHGPACPQRFPLDMNNETESLRFMSKARREHLLHVEAMLSKNQSEDCLYLNIYAPFQGRAAFTLLFYHYLNFCINYWFSDSRTRFHYKL